MTDHNVEQLAEAFGRVQAYLQTGGAVADVFEALTQTEIERDAALADAARLRAAVEAVRALCDRHEHGATRWADPLPVPEWITDIRAALDRAEGAT